MNKCPLEEMRKRMKSGERERSLYIYSISYSIRFPFFECTFDEFFFFY